jgi:cyclic pyranopterin phosphate synthase
MTTNGIKLEELVSPLKDAGLNSINVSLDAVDSDTYYRISRRKNLCSVLSGIKKALDGGIDVKINCTIVKGINETQIIPVLEYGAAQKIVVRFLELMKMGHLFDSHFRYYFSENEILNTIAKKYSFKRLKRIPSSTSEYWITNENQKFGIIANHSSPFCYDCDRIRMDSYGNIYGCLSVAQKIPLSGEFVEKESALMEAYILKQKSRFKGSLLSMTKIGG